MRVSRRTAKEGFKKELKTIAIVVSAALSALVVRYALDRADASAGTSARPALFTMANTVPIFQ